MNIGDRVEFVQQPMIKNLDQDVIGLRGTLVALDNRIGIYRIRMDTQIMDVEVQEASVLNSHDWFVPGHMLGVIGERIKVIDAASDSPTFLPVEPRQWPASSSSP